jgi:hypothetical protein
MKIPNGVFLLRQDVVINGGYFKPDECVFEGDVFERSDTARPKEDFSFW